MRAMPVVVVEEGWEAGGALSGVGVSMSVGPFAQGGLDEALGVAIGLWSVGPGEAVLEAEGGGVLHGAGAIAGAIIGVEPLSFDAVPGKESQSGMEESDGAFGGLGWEELGEAEAGMIADGDVEVFPAGARRVIVLAIAGDAMAWAHDGSPVHLPPLVPSASSAGELLDDRSG